MVNGTKTKSVMVTARQRFQMGTPTRASTSTVNGTETVRIASKTAPSTSGNTSRARNTAKVRFGIQTARATRVAGLKTAEMAMEFTTTRMATLTKGTGTSTSGMGMACTRTRRLGPSTRVRGFTGSGTARESWLTPIADTSVTLWMITSKERVNIDLISAVNSTGNSCWKRGFRRAIRKKMSSLLC